jgi:hypothetical protein
MHSIRTENLAMARQLTVLFTSALSPPFVNAGVRFLAPLPGKGGIVGIAPSAAAIVGGRIVGVKGGARAKPFRQVWIGQKLAPKPIKSAFPCWSQPSAVSWSKPPAMMSVPRYRSRISSSILSAPGSGSIPFSIAALA